jgi:hypothetical protein
VVGLALLGISLLGSHSEGSPSGYVWISIWLVASAIAAGVLIGLSRLIGGGPAWGLAAGILFGAGDVSTTMAVCGGAGRRVSRVPDRVLFGWHGGAPGRL